MMRWGYAIAPFLAAAILLAVVVTRPATVKGSAVTIDASVILAIDNDFNALQKIRGEYETSVEEMTMTAPDPAAAAARRAEDLSREWQTFDSGIKRRSDAVNAISHQKAMDRAERNYFRLRSEYAARKDSALQSSHEQLEYTFNMFSRKEPPPMLRRDKLELLTLRLNLAVITRDSFAMPEQRLNSLMEHEKKMSQDVDKRESEYIDKIQREFREESGKIAAGLGEKRRALENELELAVRSVLKDAGEDIRESAEQQTEISRTAAEQAAKARSRISGNNSLAPTPVSGDTVFPDFESAERDLEAEFLRRLSRKAPAVAERNGISIIYNTEYPGAGTAEDYTDSFRKAIAF